jgi:hypothetical protein
MLSEVADLFGPSIGAQPAADRRATRRFVDAWTRASRGRFPSWRAIRTMDLGDDWNWIFCVDLEKSSGFPYFIYLGAHLAKLSDVYLTGDTDWTMSLLDKSTADIEACVALEGPHHRDDELVLCNGRRIMFRSVTAPLADNGHSITHVAGVVSGAFKE